MSRRVSPGVSSRLLAPTAASRSRALATTGAAPEEVPPAPPAVPPRGSKTKAAMPLSLQRRPKSLVQSSPVQPRPRPASPSASATNNSLRRPSHVDAAALGASARSPRPSLADIEVPLSPVQSPRALRRTSVSLLTRPEDSSPKRRASASLSPPSQLRRRSVAGSPLATRRGSVADGLLLSPRAGSLSLSPQGSVLAVPLGGVLSDHLSATSSCHERDSFFCGDSSPFHRSMSPEPPAALTGVSLETIEGREDMDRAALVAGWSIEFFRCFERLLQSKREDVVSQITKLNLKQQHHEKKRKIDELRARALAAAAESIPMMQSIAELRSADRTVVSLRDQHAAVMRFLSLRRAQLRQKEATITVLQEKAAQLGTDSDVLLARLWVEMETVEDLTAAMNTASRLADAPETKPVQCMAFAAEVDFSREMHFESLVVTSKSIAHDGALENTHIREAQQVELELQRQVDADADVDKERVLEDWEAERGHLIAEITALRKEINDLGFQLRRGTHIKALSQLPVVRSQPERERVRQLLLEVREATVSLEKLRADVDRTVERRTNIAQYGVGRAEQATAELEGLVKQRESLEAERAQLRERILASQREAITAAPSQDLLQIEERPHMHPAHFLTAEDALAILSNLDADRDQRVSARDHSGVSLATFSKVDTGDDVFSRLNRPTRQRMSYVANRVAEDSARIEARAAFSRSRPDARSFSVNRR